MGDSKRQKRKGRPITDQNIKQISIIKIKAFRSTYYIE